MKHLFLFLSCYFLSLNLPAQDSFKESITYLTSSEVGGRYPGSIEDSLVRQWLHSKFMHSGLTTFPGSEHYIQEFEFIDQYWFDARLKLRKNGKVVDLTHYKDFRIERHGEQDSLVLDCVFISDGTNDSCLQAVKDKVVITYARPLPTYLTGYKRVSMEELAAAGAKAIIHVLPPGKTIEERRFRGNGNRSGRYSITTLTLLTRDLPLFMDEQDILHYDSLITPTSIPPWINLECTIELVVKLHEQRQSSANVIGLKKGTGDQFIVIGAHHDHLGTDKETGLYYPGANDNASGVAMLVELAEKYKDVTTSCNLLFVAFGGEEKGMLGSTYFVGNLPVKKENIKAMINLDVIGSLRGDTLYYSRYNDEFHSITDHRVQHPDLDRIVLQEKDCGLSDHIPFLLQGIPTLFFSTGNDFSQLHTTDDDEKLINYEGMYRTLPFLFNVIHLLDN